MPEVGDIIDIEYKITSSDGKELENKRLTTLFGLGFLPKFIEDLIKDKEDGNYVFEKEGKEIFGERDPNLIQVVKLVYFKRSGVNPYPGMWVEIDGAVGKVLAVSGGRVIVDFNNPFINDILKIEVSFKSLNAPIEERIGFLSSILFGKRINFKIDGSKVIVEEKIDDDMLELFREYAKRMGLEVEKND